MGIFGWIATLFTSNKVQDLAVDAVREVSGLNEMSGRERADYVLKYIESTKHQSPMRRLIAFVLTLLYAGVVLTWLVSAGIGYYFGAVESLEFAGAVKVFMTDAVVQPFNVILSFYFVAQMASRFGK